MGKFKIIVYHIVMSCLLLSGCGNSYKEKDSLTEEYTYVPEYVAVHTQETGVKMGFTDIHLCNNSLLFEANEKIANGYMKIAYYETDLLEKSESMKSGLQFPKSQRELVSIFYDQDGNYCTIESDWEARGKKEGEYSSGYCFSKYDVSGKMLLRWDITDLLEESDSGFRIVQKALTDSDGNIYIMGNRTLLLLNAEGEYHGTIVENMGIYDIGCDQNGQVYYLVSFEDELKRVDFANAQTQTVTREFISSKSMCWDVDNHLLTYNNDGIYQYNIDTGKQEMLLDWLDINVFGSEVIGITVLEDGRIVAVRGEVSEQTWLYESLELIYLTKTQGLPASQKEIITLGVMHVNDSMRKAVIAFNKSSDKYSVKIKNYLKENSQQGYEDAIMAMDLDMVSGNLPDIIDVGYADLQKYISKGLFEDLNPYLEKSESFQKEDLVEAVVNAYTFDEKLVCLPTAFRLQVIMGSASRLGSESGWTLDEMITFFDKYGDEQVYDSVSKEGILDMCLTFYQTAIVDMQGEDFLHSEELKKIVEFSKRFTGETAGWNHIKQEDGTILLKQIWFSDPEAISEMPQYFEGEEVTYIGYPTIDGSPGILLDTEWNAFGIMKDSPNKDAAWKFIEYLILEESEGDNIYSIQFSVLKESLEQRIAEAEEDPYELDEDGQIMSDKEGNPVRRIVNSNHFINNNLITYVYALLPEESEKIRELISIARPATGNHEMVANIIKEEASAYYSDQKSVEEVIGIIQNRIKTYIDENKG